MNKLFNRKRASLLSMLTCVTAMLVVIQLVFFLIDYQVAGITDALLTPAIMTRLFDSHVLLPVLVFVSLQVFAYAFIIGWVWFVTSALSECFQLLPRQRYLLGLALLLFGHLTIFLLNSYYCPHSFFAMPGLALLPICLLGVLSLTFFAYGYALMQRRFRGVGGLLMLVVFISFAPGHLDKTVSVVHAVKPNIIFIGLDSVRPDYIGYHTPTIDGFLDKAAVMTNAYTPLSRTFPSWVSVLTAKYPLHTGARMNLEDPTPILRNETLAKRLQADGYLTIYGTDETRFTDITKAYGFDRIIGPKGGAAEFLLAGLSDLPLTNLLVNLPIGRFVFPYHYANRAADITYQPETFLHLVRAGLGHRTASQPVFLAIHLCLPHWPFRWAQDDAADITPERRYRNSIEAVDRQLAGLMQILKEEGLLDHSLVVLLSDHGVTLGMRGDRVITEDRYRGDPILRKTVSAVKLGAAPSFTLDFKHDYSLSASYGQGTDVLSLKQNHVLLAFRGFGVVTPVKQTDQFKTLLDVAPTILEYLHLKPIQGADGVPLSVATDRPFYTETGDKMAEIETNDIQVGQVVKQAAGAYRIDPVSGLLVLNPDAERSIIKSKQRAVRWGQWLLAKYPTEMTYKMPQKRLHQVAKMTLVPTKKPPYFVLVNLKTGEWTVDLSSSFAKAAPIHELMERLKVFYGEEL